MKRLALWLTALIALAFLACAGKPTPRVVPLGETRCMEDTTGKVTPFAFLRIDVLFTDEAPHVIAHETDHILFARRFPSCKAYHAWLSVRDNALRNEASAFCASAHVWARQNDVTLEVAIERFAEWLAGGYPQYSITAKDAASLIREVCQ